MREIIFTVCILTGAVCLADWVKVDNFQDQQLGISIHSINSWSVLNSKITAANVMVDPEDPVNYAVRIKRIAPTADGDHDTLYQAGGLNIAPGKTGTVFMRFMVESGMDPSLGTRSEKPLQYVSIKMAVTENALNAGNPRQGVEVSGTDSVVSGFQRDKSRQPIERNKWYLLWMAVDNSGTQSCSKAYIKLQGAEGAAVQVPGGLTALKTGFGIFTGMGVIKSRDNGPTDFWIDDVYVDNSGPNLGDPLAGAGVKSWKDALAAEAEKYRHLLKKPADPAAAEVQARALVDAMKKEERYTMVCGTAQGIPGFPRLGIPAIHFTDASSGINWGPTSRERYRQTTAFPCTLLLAATWDTAMAEVFARAIGEECRAGGVHFLLGPGMNIYRTSTCGRNFEYLGEDPFLSSRIVEKYVRAVQSTGVSATLKHFIGNETDFKRRCSNSIISDRALHELYLPPFQAGIEAGTWAVMSSYNLLNGEWVPESSRVIDGILKGEMGFKWMVMTDWISTWHAEKVLTSGVDLEMPNGPALRPKMAELMERPEIDRMAFNIVKTCIAAGFYEKEFADPALMDKWSERESVARRVNEAGIVLLKNNGILPLKEPVKDLKVLVTGNAAQRKELSGFGSGHVVGYNLTTYLDAISGRFGAERVSYVESPSDEEIGRADLIFVFPGFPGGGKGGEGEGSDRDFVLPDDELIARCVGLNTRTIVGVVAGGAVRMDWAEKAAAVVFAFYGGQTGAGAFVDVLVGKINPSGKLPFSIETKFEDSPAFGYNRVGPDLSKPYTAMPANMAGQFFTDSAKQGVYYTYNVNYNEDVFVGYRWYDHKKMAVRFPFGHGLSYTTFTYENMKLEQGPEPSVILRLRVQNTGQRAGSEIVQVYVGDLECSVPRPQRELKGFAKVALAAGEAKDIEIKLDSQAFRFWHPQTRQWTLEPGEFEIGVGASSRDIRLSEKVRF